jgi:hypothetical protein
MGHGRSVWPIKVNPGITKSWVGSFTLRSLFLLGKKPRHPLNRRLAGVCLDVLEKRNIPCPSQETNPSFLAVQTVAQSLYLRVGWRESLSSSVVLLSIFKTIINRTGLPSCRTLTIQHTLVYHSTLVHNTCNSNSDAERIIMSDL